MHAGARHGWLLQHARGIAVARALDGRVSGALADVGQTEMSARQMHMFPGRIGARSHLYSSSTSHGLVRTGSH
jgi:hypothetical protein